MLERGQRFCDVIFFVFFDKMKVCFEHLMCRLKNVS
jgi:hypothetical protein